MLIHSILTVGSIFSIKKKKEKRKEKKRKEKKRKEKEKEKENLHLGYQLVAKDPVGYKLP